MTRKGLKLVVKGRRGPKRCQTDITKTPPALPAKGAGIEMLVRPPGYQVVVWANKYRGPNQYAAEQERGAS
jgi:hypothetical protein